MSTILLVGAGAVGGRTARQLAETSGVDDVLVVDHDSRRSRAVAEAVGAPCRAVEWDGSQLPPGPLDSLAVALPFRHEAAVVRSAIEAGIPVASSADEPRALEALLALGILAAERGVVVAAGCGLAPGLADVMARHAADSLDDVSEVHVARVGVGGPACTKASARSLRGDAIEWREGEWHELPRRLREEVVWFPDPAGPRECRGVEGATALLVRAFPGARRLSYRLAKPPGRLAARVQRRKRGDAPDWGAARVEVWGQRGQALETVVYGVIERTVVAAGTVLALAAAHLAAGVEAPPGVHALSTLVAPRPFLEELAHRGVKVAVFEGLAGDEGAAQAS